MLLKTACRTTKSVKQSKENNTITELAQVGSLLPATLHFLIPRIWPAIWLISDFVKFWQTVNNVHCFYANANYLFNQINDIARIIVCFVWISYNPSLLIYSYLISLNQPFDCTFTPVKL